MTSLVHDPILAPHVAALKALDIAAADCGRNAIPGLRSFEEQTVVADAAYRAVRVSIVASMAVADLVPTTEAGRQALADHLQVDWYRSEVENGRQLNDHAARTGERFTAEFEIVDAGMREPVSASWRAFICGL
jgi:hypothetical protein